MTALDELLKKQAELAKEIDNLRTGEKKSAIATIVELVEKYQITATELAKACGFDVSKSKVELVKREKVKVKPKYQYTIDGQTYEWAGRGSEKTRPKSLLKLLETKKITVEQFKKMPEYQYKG